MLRFSISFILVCFLLPVFGQTSFYNATNQIMGSERIKSTIAIAVDDINGDFKDDLILLDEGKFVSTFTQTASDRPFLYKEHYQTSAVGEWAVIAGDLNNDGKPEIIASGNENGSEILFSNNGTYITSQITSPVYTQNTNLVDLNNDGFLDLFVCNDIGENLTYLNDGDGKMTKVQMIDFKTSEDDDMSGNYSSIFTDLDNDGDLDLYIGKCRASASEPTDRRRINTLYINNGDGTYTENGVEFGLANGSQTWSVDAGDIDNDGDMDLIIANHDREHDLMINDGNGHFDRFWGLPDESKSFAYQSFFGDFDNNGWLDIFITEPANSYILYNNDMVLSQYDISQNGRGAFSGAVGDFNSDGFLDMYLGFADGFQNVGSRSDVVYLNEKNSNNWLQVNLQGTESGFDAIGSKVTVYIEGRKQAREITTGKSYGIMNSTVAHFGLGDITAIDSLVVDWAAGNQTVINNDIEVNSYLLITEDGCISPRLEIPDYELCDDSLITIVLEDSYDSYEWSDGTTDSTLQIDKSGSYYVITEKAGCKSVSNFFYVREQSDKASDEIIFAESLIGCDNEIISLKSAPALSYEWSTSEQSQEIEIIESGTYQVTISTNCDSYISDPIDIVFLESELPVLDPDTVNSGIQATLSCTGNNVNWYRNFYDESVIASGNIFETVPLFRDSTFYAGVTLADIGLSDNLMTPVPLNSNSDNDFILNDTLEFTVLAPVNISSVSVRTQLSGRRVIEVWKGRNLIKTVSIDMITGVNIVNLDLILAGGVYKITTNMNVNMNELGSVTPKFSYSDLFIGNDKVIDQYLKIGGSTVYPGQVPYFFDWKVDYNFYTCENRYPVTAIVDDNVSVEDLQFDFELAPNPSNGIFKLSTQSKQPFSIKVISLEGKVLLEKQNMLSGDYITSQLNSGIYILQVLRDYEIGQKLIVIE